MSRRSKKNWRSRYRTCRFSCLARLKPLWTASPLRSLVPTRRALLAYLAVESARPHRRAELAGMLWPDLLERKAAHNLSQTLLRLRGVLREPKGSAHAARQPFLLVTAHDIQFNPHSDHRLDVAVFEELLRASRQHHHSDSRTCAVCNPWLQQAADLYRGEQAAADNSPTGDPPSPESQEKADPHGPAHSITAVKIEPGAAPPQRRPAPGVPYSSFRSFAAFSSSSRNFG